MYKSFTNGMYHFPVPSVIVPDRCLEPQTYLNFPRAYREAELVVLLVLDQISPKLEWNRLAGPVDLVNNLNTQQPIESIRCIDWISCPRTTASEDRLSVQNLNGKTRFLETDYRHYMLPHSEPDETRRPLGYRDTAFCGQVLRCGGTRGCSRLSMNSLFNFCVGR
ncbi:hypothetical protein BD779DRAFT_971086 [Infundibulicybe gibba]|nr:hypothetical protein BD779DRAFT_971086 [Infundibulicybe gibba]